MLRTPLQRRSRHDVNPILQHLVQLRTDHDARAFGGIGVLAAGGFGLTVLLRKNARVSQPPAEELERWRRERLARIGRITDGVILACQTFSGEDTPVHSPEVLIYSYRIAGVTYQCAQDVSRLGEQLAALNFNLSIIDQTVQVRYDPHSPGNSILLAETWTGLWRRNQGPASDPGCKSGMAAL